MTLSMDPPSKPPRDGSRRDRVLVVGGGIAGLAVRRALHRRGIPSLTLERRGDPADAGLAINLPGNAVQALAQLGLGEALRVGGSPIRRREYRTDRGRLLFAVDEAAFWGHERIPHCLRRADLLRLLEQDPPSGDLRRDCAVAGLSQDEAGVAVTLADGTVETGGLLVGADGVHSTVRSGLFGDEALGAALLAPASWRFMVPNPGVEAWTLWAGKGSLFLLIPVDRGEVYGWVSAAGLATARPDPALLHGLFASYPRPVRDALDAALSRPGSMHHSPLEEVRIASWHRGRVVLAGDAAHATAPVWAQGAALALEDALVLADLLAGPTAGWGGIGATYEARRRPRITHVQAMTDRMSRSARLPGWARRLVLPVVGPRSYRATYTPLRVPVTADPSGA